MIISIVPSIAIPQDGYVADYERTAAATGSLSISLG
jgi:hypothetical protein